METISIKRFPKNTSILLKEVFLKEFRHKIKSEDKLNLKRTTNSYRGFGNLGKILDICKKYDININELEKNIVAYRTTQGRVTIINPILPIAVTPIFDMLIAHAIGDGFCSHLKNRIPAFVYRQYRNEILDLFLKKMESVFGKIIYKEDYFYNQKHIYMPSVLSHILYSYYSLKPEDFLENNSKIPKEMINKDKEYLIAILIAFILDEGSIDSSNIVIGLNNKNLLYDIKSICDKLGYDNILRSGKERSHLYILSNGVIKFWKDYVKIKVKYHEVSLDYKESFIENFILRKNKLWRTAQQGETQNKIIKLLKESDKTVKELSIILQISRQGTKWHLTQLEKMSIVRRIGKGYAGSDVYRLEKYAILPIKIRGRSRQCGVTDEKIISILRRNSMTTKEISDRMKIDRAAILHFMNNLEKIGKVKRMGQKIHRTHPSIIWSIE